MGFFSSKHRTRRVNLKPKHWAETGSASCVRVWNEKYRLPLSADFFIPHLSLAGMRVNHGRRMPRVTLSLLTYKLYMENCCLFSPRLKANQHIFILMEVLRLSWAPWGDVLGGHWLCCPFPTLQDTLLPLQWNVFIILCYTITQWRGAARSLHLRSLENVQIQTLFSFEKIWALNFPFIFVLTVLTEKLFHLRFT